MMKKILLLTITKESMTYSKDAGIYNVDLDTIFKKRTYIIRLLVKLSLYININLTSLFFCHSWKRKLNSINTVVIVAHPDSINVVRYLNKKYPQIKVNIWYNNPIIKEISPKYFKDLNCKIWTFDRKDSSKYELKYKNQYIDLSPIELNKMTEKKFDIVFIGKNKGRLNLLMEIENTAKIQGLKTYFHIVPSREDDLLSYDFKSPILYQELIKIESESEAIVDIVQEGQSGITLRALEALFLNSKLITNNKSVKKEKFYHPNNILILDKYNLKEMKEFLEKPIYEVDKEIKHLYSFKGWIKTFNT